ncbi:PAS domain S-box protein [Chitiniphilus purpureus]|uniref:histidine kinase n=1 Tax=Chitiniphilus purpureus TaxID=2981137 RepID=A0ABY6DI98_9NEIS|nr:ATP-binding protein [Chitiniphilus sp. CD1]UXY13757.1 PAS domain S-box protein [Chitiniphilus sp. CD1]
MNAWRNRLWHAWADQPLRVKGLVVIAMPLAILLGSLGLIYLVERETLRVEDEVRRTLKIQSNIHRVHSLISEAATGVRGFLLIGRDDFLTRYREAEQRLPQTLAQLEQDVRDPEQRLRLAVIAQLVRHKLTSLAALHQARLDTHESRTQHLLQSLVDSKALFDRLRNEIDAMQAREAILLAERQAEANRVRSRYLAVTGTAAGVGLLGSVLAVWLFFTGIVRRVHLLADNARRLEQGEALVPLRSETDEIGHLAAGMERAGHLLAERERALRESEERLRLVIEGARDYGIFALDPTGHVVSWNTGAERIKGFRAEEIVGRHFSLFYPQEERGTLPAEALAQAERTGWVESEGWRLRKDGSRFWANVVITALRDEAGQLRGFSKITRDITERRAAEEALRQAREEAERASQAKSEFLSRISHELRTPLNAILGFAQLMEMEATDPNQRRSVEQIVKGGRHLLRLINEVLDIARIEAGRMELALEAVPAAEVLDEAIELTAPLAASAGVALQREVGPLLERRILADRQRLIQVILNLLSNAVKYNRQPGGVVTVSGALEDGRLRIEVVDTGMGIEPELLARLFTPFERLGAERSQVEGTGLGLALSKRLIEAMHGRIGVHSMPGVQSTFWVTLPLAADGMHAAPPTHLAVPQPLPSGGPLSTILCIEDNLSNLALLEHILKRRPGVRMLPAMQGSLGLALAREHRPDLILLDLNLPDLPGDAVLAQLRTMPESRHTPVVMISADATAAAEARLRAAGVADYLTKPLDVVAFLAVVDRLLNAPRARPHE